jgi:hypothetical protein
MDNDPDLDHQAQDADDYYQDIVVEDAASMPDGCLGLIAIMLSVGAYLVLKF